jgi:hypothetical protein
MLRMCYILLVGDVDVLMRVLQRQQGHRCCRHQAVAAPLSGWARFSHVLDIMREKLCKGDGYSSVPGDAESCHALQGRITCAWTKKCAAYFHVFAVNFSELHSEASPNGSQYCHVFSMTFFKGLNQVLGTIMISTCRCCCCCYCCCCVAADFFQRPGNHVRHFGPPQQ